MDDKIETRELSEELLNKVSSMKLRIWFCIHKYIIPIIKTYNAGRNKATPIMTDEWIRGFLLKELIEALNLLRKNNKHYVTDFGIILLNQYYNTHRHVKTGINYEVYLTIAHVLKSYRADLTRVNDPKLIEDMYNLIDELNEDR